MNITRPFANLGVVEAAEAVLRQAGHPIHTAEIAARAMAGGMPSVAKNQKRNMFNILSRQASGRGAKVVKTSPGMRGLPEWPRKGGYVP